MKGNGGSGEGEGGPGEGLVDREPREVPAPGGGVAVERVGGPDPHHVRRVEGAAWGGAGRKGAGGHTGIVLRTGGESSHDENLSNFFLIFSMKKKVLCIISKGVSTKEYHHQSAAKKSDLKKKAAGHRDLLWMMTYQDPESDPKQRASFKADKTPPEDRVSNPVIQFLMSFKSRCVGRSAVFITQRKNRPKDKTLSYIGLNMNVYSIK